MLVINKVDRADARIAEVVHQVEELFLDLDADEDQIDFPILYANARAGWVSTEPGVEGENVEPLFRAIIDHVPAPSFDPDAGTQALVCNLSASPYVGRLAICRVHNGTLVKGNPVAWCRLDGTIEKVKITELYVTEALDQVPAESAGPGEIVSVAGLAEVTIGETLADRRPAGRPAGHHRRRAQPGHDHRHQHVTAVRRGRHEADRPPPQGPPGLPSSWATWRSGWPRRERPDMWEVLGRGELQLAVLVETMRREGFELTVGKPQVVTREIDGKVYEPVERVSIDVPDEYLGVVTQLLALRKGTMSEMVNHGTGWVRFDYRVPARGLIGFRTEFLTETRGTGILHHVFDGWEPWHGDLRTRRNGSMVADRRGVTTTFALMNLQERGTLIVGPAEEVYEGMIVGENARADEMDVNPTKEKKLNNIRSATAEDFERLTPAMNFSLEHALEFISEDECVEVTPKAVRLRKVLLDQAIRGRLRSRARDAAQREQTPLLVEVGTSGRGRGMVTARTEGFDHITIVVTDLPEARRFFGLLGFEESIAVVASGEQVSAYMGIPGWESDHVTLVLQGVDVHQEIQLLFFHAPPIKVDSGAGTLDRTGFNHVCFRVNDLAAMLEHLAANGITPRNEVLDYHDRKLVFLDGPGVVVELAEWAGG